MGTRLGLDTDAWPTGWSEGGSEAGVIRRNFMADSASDKTLALFARVFKLADARFVSADTTSAPVANTVAVLEEAGLRYWAHSTR
ncbi:hypothetical protein [Streptomyces sp. NEAU-YJ-81]|uniref:hypothetical protein n=1 Tax=Streptomyces sp. NEAU-YJ-81 TaxID=2820288 RepID=UPI001ABCB5FA|nr:hypothetical protein [Streptomyces sp. NEAU-YJ-81]MBO3676896.1 hypothetical protein [Streptomyces sp. NEAU-YJ-81]